MHTCVDSRTCIHTSIHVYTYMIAPIYMCLNKANTCLRELQHFENLHVSVLEEPKTTH